MIRSTFSKLKTIFTPRPSARNISPRLLELATSGNVDAQAKLAEIYFNDGGEEHYAASLHWNRQAARQGHPAAQARLVTIYQRGLGVERDLKEASRWLRNIGQPRSRSESVRAVTGKIVKQEA
ncbi:tetratricopeptide repeat protein [Ensifer sp. 2YAB10]|uniref:tetratricopeptide repeat protein n=1 Tax=unclassified Ensifer TaxID=2633371 RepID=UPI001A5D45E4|nr:tetratricopeptide repeat protein [Ensifer sp. SSB1]MBK5569951.1 sel1 repeat family protein [Ensifer sp. SSB1]